MKKTAAPADPDDIGAKLDRIIELLEQRAGQTIIYQRPPSYPVNPYVYPWWQVWSGTSTSSGYGTVTYNARDPYIHPYA